MRKIKSKIKYNRKSSLEAQLDRMNGVEVDYTLVYKRFSGYEFPFARNFDLMAVEAVLHVTLP